MDERNNHFDFDFTPIGLAIKKAREARGMTREELSGIIGYAPRHIQSIENEGQYPSIELFIQLITMFDVSVDEYIFPDKEDCRLQQCRSPPAHRAYPSRCIPFQNCASDRNSAR